MSTVAHDLRSSFFAVATIAVLVVLQSLRVASAEPLAPSEPPNVGDAKFAAIAYYKSGAYERDLAAVASRVSARLAERAPQVSRAALVLDIDDTVLSNWEVIMADDFGRVFEGPCRSLPNGPCGWVAWDLRARTPAIQQMLAVFKQARSLGVAVFFISGRDERQRAATIKACKGQGSDGRRPRRGNSLDSGGLRRCRVFLSALHPFAHGPVPWRVRPRGCGLCDRW
jgi:predicted secreted acid phosphatase